MRVEDSKVTGQIHEGAELQPTVKFTTGQIHEEVQVKFTCEERGVGADLSFEVLEIVEVLPMSSTACEP